MLCRPITKNKQKIRSLESGKAPSPDGFSALHFTFAELVVDPLLHMYTESFEKGFLTPTLYAANITLILKSHILYPISTS